MRPLCQWGNPNGQTSIGMNFIYSMTWMYVVDFLILFTCSYSVHAILLHSILPLFSTTSWTHTTRRYLFYRSPLAWRTPTAFHFSRRRSSTSAFLFWSAWTFSSLFASYATVVWLNLLQKFEYLDNAKIVRICLRVLWRLLELFVQDVLEKGSDSADFSLRPKIQTLYCCNRRPGC